MRRVWQEEKGERAILAFMIANDNAIAVGAVDVLLAHDGEPCWKGYASQAN
jgi:hypothetical protein